MRRRLLLTGSQTPAGLARWAIGLFSSSSGRGYLLHRFGQRVPHDIEVAIDMDWATFNDA